MNSIALKARQLCRRLLVQSRFAVKSAVRSGPRPYLVVRQFRFNKFDWLTAILNHHYAEARNRFIRPEQDAVSRACLLQVRYFECHMRNGLYERMQG